MALVVMLAPFLAQAAPYADYVIDARTGEVLHEQNSDTRLHPASLTKMMTLYIAFEAIERGEISLDSRVTISKHAASQPPSRLGLKPGQTIALRYLIRAAAIKSANDAATAIGEAIEGSESAFAKRMNRTAKALGMSRSSFVNANGLTAKGHLSTAKDMTTLGRHLFYDFPQYYNIFSRTSADAGVSQVASTNRRFLSAYKGADGIKTGYTSAAGFNLTASAQRGSERIIATILGGKSTADRNSRMASLLDLGFSRAPSRAMVQKPQAPVYLADNDATEGLVDSASVDAAVDAAFNNGTGTAAGKTIRLKVAIAKSPRPRSRPLPGAPAPESQPADALLVAMQTDIDSALAEAQDLNLTGETTEEPAEAADLASNTEDAGDEPALTASITPATPPQPESLAALALPATEPEVATEALQLSEASSIAPKASVKPPAAPRGAIADAVALALAEAIAPEATEGPATDPAPSDAIVTAAGPLAAEPGEVIADADIVTDDATTEAEAEAAETVMVAAAEPAADTPTPKSKPSQIVLAAAAPDEPATQALEVVTRVSTSGGRQWGINVGHYGSRYNAERQLLQVALIESSSLDEALRKVVSRNGGFDANFVGMTQEMAELACVRLQARQNDCTVVGP